MRLPVSGELVKTMLLFFLKTLAVLLKKVFEHTDQNEFIQFIRQNIILYYTYHQEFFKALTLNCLYIKVIKHQKPVLF